MKLTYALVEQVVELKRDGLCDADIIAAIGVHQVTFYRWLKGGVLTDPNNDARTWFWAHYCEDGEDVLTATSTPDATRTLRASGKICAIGKYVGLGFTPWDGVHVLPHRHDEHARRT